MGHKPPDELGIRDVIRRKALARLGFVGDMLLPRIRANSPDRTGELDRSYAYEVDESEYVLRIGTELERGKFIELGTVRMSPRAPIRRTLNESADEILRVLGDTGD